ncbi:MAG: ABC transporter permease [Acidobacteriota bacterium]
MSDVLRDLKHSLRMFRQRPGFTLAALAALTLGIGANTAIFSVVNSVLLKPLPFPDPDRLVLFLNVGSNGGGSDVSVTKFNVWRQQTRAFQDAAAYAFGVMNLTEGKSPEQLPSARVTAEFFRLFGARTAIGRTFTADEDRPNGGRVVVLSYGLWQRRFGGDPQVVGRTLRLSGDSYVVIGVLAPSFNSAWFDPFADVWTPFQMDPASTDQAHYFTAAARLKPGVSMAMADTQMRAAAEQFRAKFPAAIAPKATFGVQRLQERMVRNVRTSLRVLVGAVSCVLLIACANVANLLLVRATSRKPEIAIRAAMGAARGRIVRQLLTENLLLSLAGGALGLGLGMAGIRALLAVNPGDIPRIGVDGSGVTADWRVVAFTAAVSLATGLVFGLFPALEASRADLNLTLKENSSRSGSGFRQNKARSILVIVEMALALVLLVGASLLIRSFMALRAVNPGFVSRNVLTMRMSMTEPKYTKAAGVDQLIRAGLERLRNLPGVDAVSATCCVPLEDGYHLPFEIVGRPSEAAANNGAGWYTISSGYFDVFRIPMLRGRDFTDRDSGAAGGVVIINQAMAKRFWPKGDPLTDQIAIGKGVGPAFAEGPRQIVGIVGDARDGGLNQDPQPAMYVPFAQVSDGVTALTSKVTALGWVVRTRGEPHGRYGRNLAIQKALQEASGGLPVARIQSMDEIVVKSTARSDFNMLLLTVFGCVALLLAAIGIYGSMAYSVEQRTKEIGIRLALGASVGRVRNMVIAQGMTLALAGVVLGLFGAFALSKPIESLLFGVTARDPMVFVAVPVALAAVALIAVWLPALRATRIDPIDALRCA